ncbi:hypothetical protein Tco_1204592 [Tanacetum coccineum]
MSNRLQVLEDPAHPNMSTEFVKALYACIKPQEHGMKRLSNFSFENRGYRRRGLLIKLCLLRRIEENIIWYSYMLMISSNGSTKSLWSIRLGVSMYLTASRPDIIFAVCLCARFKSLQRFLIYMRQKDLKVPQHINLNGFYGILRTSFHLEAFSDIGLAGTIMSRHQLQEDVNYLGRDCLLALQATNKLAISLQKQNL